MAMHDPTAVYDQAHVQVQALLGRTYNNPFGPELFPLLWRLLGQRQGLRVLDVGCGRGQSALWWAQHTEAQVDAIDPSPSMLAAARHSAATEAAARRVTFHQATLTDFARESPGHTYDLVLSHDVLCYEADFASAWGHMAERLAPGGLASVTAYFADAPSAALDAVMQAWAIARPPRFADLRPTLEQGSQRCLTLLDSTGHYARHWREIRQRLSVQREDAVTQVGAAVVDAFAAKVATIIAAVEAGTYGHWWGLVQR